MAVETLVESYRKFREKCDREYIQHFQKLAKEGQSPKTFFISCSDSRVVPNLITHTRPGDLFIDRNIGNIVPPFEEDGQCCAVSASIEYAIFALEVENIIVCGHSHCGACKALYEELPDDASIAHIRRWLEYAQAAKGQALALVGMENKEALLVATEKFNVVEQLKNLMSYPLVKERVLQGELFLQGWYYHIGDGSIEYFDPVTHAFVPIEEMIKDDAQT